MEHKIDYYVFFDRLKVSEFYKKFRKLSLTDFKINILFTEFSFLLSELKVGVRNEGLFQKSINVVFLTISFTDTERIELEQIFLETGLNELYTIPSKEWISKTTYDSELNHIYSKEPPFPSWVIDPSVGYWENAGRGWGPPLPYPDGHLIVGEMAASHNKCKLYNWDENLYQMDNTKGWVKNPESDYWNKNS